MRGYSIILMLLASVQLQTKHEKNMNATPPPLAVQNDSELFSDSPAEGQLRVSASAITARFCVKRTQRHPSPRANAALRNDNEMSVEERGKEEEEKTTTAALL